MDERPIRETLDTLRLQLALVEQEHQALLSSIKGLEELLRIHSGSAPVGTDATQTHAARRRPVPPRQETGKFAQKGQIPLSTAIIRVLRDVGRGRAMHVNDIWIRAQALGAASSSKDKLSNVDSITKTLIGKQPIQRVRSREYRWTGTLTDLTPQEIPAIQWET